MSRGIDNKDSGAFKSSSKLVGKVHRTARDLERTIENLSVDHLMDNVAGGAVGSGFRGSATLQSAISGAGGQRKKDERKREAALRRAINDALERMDQQLAAIDLRRGEIAEMLQGAEDVIETINNGEAVELDDDGTLKNKAAEKALKEFEKRTGKKVDRNDPDAVLEALIIIQAELKQEDRDLADKRDRIADAKQEVRQQTSIEGIEKIEEEVELAYEGIAAYRQQADIQETEIIERTPLTNRPNEAIIAAKDNETAAYEFEKGYAEAAKIEDPTERLIAEKALVDGLSEENRRFVEFSTEHYHVFEPGYFDSLDQAGGPEQTAQVVNSPTTPELGS